MPTNEPTQQGTYTSRGLTSTPSSRNTALVKTESSKATRRLGETDQSAPTAHTAPGLMFFLGGLGLLFGIITNLTQLWTSFSAFLTMLVTGSVFLSLKPADQAKVMSVLIIMAAVIAIGVQTGVLFVAFRVDTTWKRKRAEGPSALRATAVEIAHQPTLLLLYGAVCFIANCIGDYGFVTTYTDSLLVLFFWGLVLTAGSTLILMEAAQYLWSGLRAYQAYKAQFLHITQQRPQA